MLVGSHRHLKLHLVPASHGKSGASIPASPLRAITNTSQHRRSADSNSKAYTCNNWATPITSMSFPVLNSTKPFWRSNVHDIDTHRSTPNLPTEADIVIVGAGYSGASIAHHLLEKYKESLSDLPSIVILEAREACSGATGRNGGHLKPDPYYRAASALRTHGKKLAEEVASFEARQVKEIQKLVEKEKIDCDYVVTRACDVCLYDEADRELKKGLDELTAAGVSTASEVFYTGGKAAEGVSGIKAAKSCFTYTAGHIWPYKLVSHLLSSAVSQGVNLQTTTPVQSISPTSNDASRPWSVNTSRGSILASKVIFSTNAYTSSLSPQFKRKIIPVKGICCRIVCPDDQGPHLSNSYILRLAKGEYDYLIPRSDGSIIVGGARRDHYKDLKAWYDVVDDGNLIDSAKGYFDGYMQRHFRGWKNSGAKVDEIWSGIMGYSSDGFPFVGEVPGQEGQYICAGFSGHGMPQIYLSAKALVDMVVDGKRGEELDLPTLYRTSKARMNASGEVTMEAWEAQFGQRSKL